MFKINKKVEYALMALKYMDALEDGAKVSVKEITDVHRSPFDVTSRAMQKMTAKGILKSEKGAYGGYMLDMNLEELSFLKLSEIVVGPQYVAKCVLDPESCDGAKVCGIVGSVSVLDRRLRALFETISVKELIDEGESGTLYRTDNQSEEETD